MWAPFNFQICISGLYILGKGKGNKYESDRKVAVKTPVVFLVKKKRRIEWKLQSLFMTVEENAEWNVVEICWTVVHITALNSFKFIYSYVR